MYQIALCDDEAEELSKIECMLYTYQQKNPKYDFRVDKFTDMNSLLTELIQGQHFDLLLLDIYLPDKTGMEGYLELRENGYEFPVVFLTNSPDYALEAFQVNAIQYLVKPVPEESFSAALDKAFLYMEEQNRYILLQTKGELWRVAICNIIYCESQDNHQCLWLGDGTKLRVRMTVAELFDRLNEFSEFVRLGRAYIINLSHVSKLMKNTVYFDSGQTIWLPRGTYPELKKQYFNFYCGGR